MNNSNFFISLILTFLVINSLQSQTIDWSVKANPSSLSINGVVFKEDGQKVLTGTNCHPAAIRIFDVPTSNLDWDYTVGSDFYCIMGVSFSSNTNYIAAAEESGYIFIFDNTGISPVILDTINTGTGITFSTSISPDNSKVAVGAANGKLFIYSISDGTLLNEITAHQSWVLSVNYSPNGNYIVTGGSDSKVKIWDSNGTLIYTCSGHTGQVTNVKVSPDNNYVISSSKDDKIKIWDINTGLLVRTLAGHTKDVNGIDLSPDGSKIVSASSDSTSKIWDFNTGDIITTFGVLDSGAVNTVAWSPLGNKIATGNGRSDVVLWDLSTLDTKEVSKGNKLEFMIQPNPSDEFIQIYCPSDCKIVSIEITDLSGTIVQSIKSEKTIQDISNLESGSYWITVKTLEGIKKTKQFIKY